MDALWFDDVELDQQWESPARTVTEVDVVNFASVTGDYNPLHIDHHFASQSVYRKPIAHGLLGLSWVAGLGSTSPSMNTIAFTAVKQWEFLVPIFFGDTVHVSTRCLAKTPKGKKSGQIQWQRKLINQRDQVVQQGVFETLVAVRPHVEVVDKPSGLKGPNFAVKPSSTPTTKKVADAD